MCVFNTRVLAEVPRVLSCVTRDLHFHGMCVFNTRACSIDVKTQGVNRYSPADFSLALWCCVFVAAKPPQPRAAFLRRSYLPGSFPHVVRGLPWLAARAVILRPLALRRFESGMATKRRRTAAPTPSCA